MNTTNAYYKYRPLYTSDGGGNRVPHPFTQAIFESAEIYYSLPKDFNDPYDCNLKLHADDSTDAEWHAHCDKLSAKYPNRKAQMETIKSEERWRVKPELSKNIGDETYQKFYGKSSVFCLSKKKNSIPMFSYYADSHRGIAIEFQFSDAEIPCGIPYYSLSHRGVHYQGKIVWNDVEYPATFPDLNYHRLYDNPQMITTLIFTKHHEWKHEEEYRIFRIGVPAKKVKFEKKLLTRVIFGCKTVAADVDLVRGWIAGWPFDVVFSKAEISPSEFNLRITDFEVVPNSRPTQSASSSR